MCNFANEKRQVERFSRQLLFHKKQGEILHLTDNAWPRCNFALGQDGQMKVNHPKLCIKFCIINMFN